MIRAEYQGLGSGEENQDQALQSFGSVIKTVIGDLHSSIKLLESNLDDMLVIMPAQRNSILQSLGAVPFLPSDMVVEIFYKHLTPKDALSFRMVSKTLKDVLLCNALWERFYLKRWRRSPKEDQIYEAQQNTESYYKTFIYAGFNQLRRLPRTDSLHMQVFSHISQTIGGAVTAIREVPLRKSFLIGLEDGRILEYDCKSEQFNLKKTWNILDYIMPTANSYYRNVSMDFFESIVVVRVNRTLQLFNLDLEEGDSADLVPISAPFDIPYADKLCSIQATRSLFILHTSALFVKVLIFSDTTFQTLETISAHCVSCGDNDNLLTVKDCVVSFWEYRTVIEWDFDDQTWEPRNFTRHDKLMKKTLNCHDSITKLIPDFNGQPMSFYGVKCALKHHMASAIFGAQPLAGEVKLTSYFLVLWDTLSGKTSFLVDISKYMNASDKVISLEINDLLNGIICGFSNGTFLFADHFGGSMAPKISVSEKLFEQHILIKQVCALSDAILFLGASDELFVVRFDVSPIVLSVEFQEIDNVLRRHEGVAEFPPQGLLLCFWRKKVRDSKKFIEDNIDFPQKILSELRTIEDMFSISTKSSKYLRKDLLVPFREIKGAIEYGKFK